MALEVRMAASIVPSRSRSPRASVALLKSVSGRRALSSARPSVGAVSLALLLAYAVVAPGTAQDNGFKLLIAFAIGQASVIARVVMRAWTLASAQALWRASEHVASR